MSQDTYNQVNMVTKRDKGLSLIEMMVALFFFSTIALGLAYSLTGSAFLTAKNQEVITANNLAKLYLNNLNVYWANQEDFDNKNTLPPIDTAEYTNEGRYTAGVIPDGVPVTFKDPITNIVTIKRVTVAYYDKESGKKILQLSKEYCRPSNFESIK